MKTFEAEVRLSINYAGIEARNKKEAEDIIKQMVAAKGMDLTVEKIKLKKDSREELVGEIQ